MSDAVEEAVFGVLLRDGPSAFEDLERATGARAAALTLALRMAVERGQVSEGVDHVSGDTLYSWIGHGVTPGGAQTAPEGHRATSDGHDGTVHGGTFEEARSAPWVRQTAEVVRSRTRVTEVATEAGTTVRLVPAAEGSSGDDRVQVTAGDDVVRVGPEDALAVAEAIVRLLEGHS